MLPRRACSRGQTAASAAGHEGRPLRYRCDDQLHSDPPLIRSFDIGEVIPYTSPVSLSLFRSPDAPFPACSAAPLSGWLLQHARPFSDPGQQARQLATANLPPARLAVPTSSESLLSDDAAKLWAHDVAEAMVAQSVPAIAQPKKPGDWWLKLSASTRNGAVVPHYVIMTPEGKARAEGDGAPVDMAGWVREIRWPLRAPQCRRLRNWPIS